MDRMARGVGSCVACTDVMTQNFANRFALLCSSALLAMLVAARPAPAAILEVPSEYYPTIQAAIDSASSGDVVLIAPGIYVEKPTIAGKSVTLASFMYTTGDRSYIDQTIIDGNRGDRVIRTSSSALHTTIMGLTIRNADDGVYARGKMTFRDNRVTGTRDGIDFGTPGGGLVRGCMFEGNGDDGIDLDDDVDVVIEHNTIRNNGDDGIEMRFQPYTGTPLAVVIRNNHISGNEEDGIQLISYDVLTSRTVAIEGNLIVNNAMAGIGIMCCTDTYEDYQGASLLEPVRVINNTFVGNDHGITGGDSLVVLNNIFANTTNVAMKNVDAGSVVAHNLFFANGTDHVLSNVDSATTLYQDPLLLHDYVLGIGSPAVDAGAATFEANGRVVSSMNVTDYSGAAPDLGARETIEGVSVTAGDVSRGIEFLPPAPNPSRGTTRFSVSLSVADHIQLEIVDVTGRRVRSLADGPATAGRHEYTWDGRTASGHAVPAGIYFARLRTAGRFYARRLVRFQ